MEEERKQAAAADSGDGGPKTRGRASSSSAVAAAAAAVKPTQSPSPSLQDRGAIALLLADAFPARSSEIKLLLGLLGQPCDPLLPTFVYGGPSTGKTSILLEIFNRLGRPFAYASCRSLHSPRILFESVLNQLLGHSRCAGNNFASAKKCDKLSDFVASLPDACDVAISSKNGHTHSKKSSARELTGIPSPCPMSKQQDGTTPCRPVVYLVFDNTEFLLDWTGGFRLFSALLRLSEFTSLPNLGLIFISSLGPDTFFSGTGMLEPISVYFREYTDDELHQILLKRKPHAELYSSFLSAVLKTFSRVTRRVTELAEALEPLFQKYLEPICKGIVKPDEHGKRKLFSLIQPHVTMALYQTCGSGRSLPLSGSAPMLSGGNRSSMEKRELEFQLSLCSKYLLVSAFICSRNPATLDATFFDSSGGGSKKRRRKSSQTHLEKKELEREEKLLKGPGTFPLERLLAIFSCISAEAAELSDVTETDMLIESSEASHGMELSSDVLMQVSTLVNANLLYKGSSDPLEGAPRYRCNAHEELVQIVARSIDFPLSRYLYRL